MYRLMNGYDDCMDRKRIGDWSGNYDGEYNRATPTWVFEDMMEMAIAADEDFGEDRC